MQWVQLGTTTAENSAQIQRKPRGSSAKGAHATSQPLSCRIGNQKGQAVEFLRFQKMRKACFPARAKAKPHCKPFLNMLERCESDSRKTSSEKLQASNRRGTYHARKSSTVAVRVGEHMRNRHVGRLLCRHHSRKLLSQPRQPRVSPAIGICSGLAPAELFRSTLSCACIGVLFCGLQNTAVSLWAPWWQSLDDARQHPLVCAEELVRRVVWIEGGACQARHCNGSTY